MVLGQDSYLTKASPLVCSRLLAVSLASLLLSCTGPEKKASAPAEAASVPATPAPVAAVARPADTPASIAQPDPQRPAPSVDFPTFIDGLRKEALSAGIKASTLDRAFAGIQPVPRVLELDRNQAEFKLTLEDYIGRNVTATMIADGKRHMRENKALLDTISQTYGVQSRFIVSLWGMESRYGRFTGSFKVIPSLATLAWDPRRSTFFRRQLMDALRIVDEGHIAPEAMLGSWAGAMGQSQFMPSTFARFAVDHDGDGRRDIWTSKADVFASAANYLSKSGWKASETWGRAVKVPQGFDPGQATMSIEKPLREWAAMGVTQVDGSALPDSGIATSIVMPSGPAGQVFAAYNNYKVILIWNRSNLYAIAVGMLADRISDG